MSADRDWYEDSITETTAQARVLGMRGYDVSRIDWRDYPQVLETGLMPRRHPDTGVIYLEGLIPAPRLFSAAEAEAVSQPFAVPLREFVDNKEDAPDPLLADDENGALAPARGLLMMVGKGGRGKTTLAVDLALSVASGVPWLGFDVPRPLRVLLIENEGPKRPFQDKLAAKLAAWPHEITGAIFVRSLNWGSFSFADDEQATQLRAFVVAERIDLVVADPLDTVGVEGVGSPEDTRKFMGVDEGRRAVQRHRVPAPSSPAQRSDRRRVGRGGGSVGRKA